jgi:aryl-alcohol dehydrogenase-like predicted oxidoreductase
VRFSVEEIAKAHNISMAQVAIAWSLSKDGMTAPIIGTTSLKNLEDIIGEPGAKLFYEADPDTRLGAIDVKLTEEEIKQLEEPYIPQAIIGHN